MARALSTPSPETPSLQFLMPMDTWTFGWTLALVGMGGTMLVLWLMSLIIVLIRKIFPTKPEESVAGKG